MANYQAARALMGKGTNRAKKGARKSAVKKGETKEMTLATAGFVSQDMLTDPFFSFRKTATGKIKKYVLRARRSAIAAQ